MASLADLQLLEQQVTGRIDVNAANIASLQGELSAQIEGIRAQMAADGMQVTGMIQDAATFPIARVQENINQVWQRLEQMKEEKRFGSWNIKDPKMRGTAKFAGEKKDDVKAFVQWKKSAYIYLDKFVPNLS